MNVLKVQWTSFAYTKGTGVLAPGQAIPLLGDRRNVQIHTVLAVVWNGHFLLDGTKARVTEKEVTMALWHNDPDAMNYYSSLRMGGLGSYIILDAPKARFPMVGGAVVPEEDAWNVRRQVLPVTPLAWTQVTSHLKSITKYQRTWDWALAVQDPKGSHGLFSIADRSIRNFRILDKLPVSFSPLVWSVGNEEFDDSFDALTKLSAATNEAMEEERELYLVMLPRFNTLRSLTVLEQSSVMNNPPDWLQVEETLLPTSVYSEPTHKLWKYVDPDVAKVEAIIKGIPLQSKALPTGHHRFDPSGLVVL